MTSRVFILLRRDVSWRSECLSLKRLGRRDAWENLLLWTTLWRVGTVIVRVLHAEDSCFERITLEHIEIGRHMNHENVIVLNKLLPDEGFIGWIHRVVEELQILSPYLWGPRGWKARNSSTSLYSGTEELGIFPSPSVTRTQIEFLRWPLVPEGLPPKKGKDLTSLIFCNQRPEFSGIEPQSVRN